MGCPQSKLNQMIIEMMVVDCSSGWIGAHVFKNQQPLDFCEEVQHDHQSCGDRRMCLASSFHHSLDMIYIYISNDGYTWNNISENLWLHSSIANKSHLFLRLFFDNLGHFPARLFLQFLKFHLLFSCDLASTVWKSIQPWPRINTEITTPLQLHVAKS